MAALLLLMSGEPDLRAAGAAVLWSALLPEGTAAPTLLALFWLLSTSRVLFLCPLLDGLALPVGVGMCGDIGPEAAGTLLLSGWALKPMASATSAAVNPTKLGMSPCADAAGGGVPDGKSCVGI